MPGLSSTVGGNWDVMRGEEIQLFGAVGVLMGRNAWAAEEARTRLGAAAAKAGVPLPEVAAVILALDAV